MNVLANPHFGSVISESGQAYTWGENAHEFRLTPWHNDPVSDASGEAFYLRDEESGHFWSPTPLPRRGATPYVSRHGFGYSVFEHAEDGIHSELWVYVAQDAAVKFSVLKVRNTSGRPRRLSATGYVEWVLGDLRPRSAMHVITEVDPDSGALYARNPYNTEFPDRVAFFDVDDANRTVTCDRAEFIGRNGSLENPAAMARTHLSGKAGRGLDPCAAIQVGFDLADGQEREITFRLGLGGVPGGDDAEPAGASLPRRRRRAAGPGGGLALLEPHPRRGPGGDARRVAQRADQRLAAVPDPGLPPVGAQRLLPVGRRLRLPRPAAGRDGAGARRARAAARAAAAVRGPPVPGRRRPALVASALRPGRAHPLFRRLPVAGAGDLPLRARAPATPACWMNRCPSWKAARSIRTTSPTTTCPAAPMTAESLYQHCVRAIRHGLRFGAHGLPLIGSGDWNDGMNRVGIEGKGESVWLGFFLYEVLRQFGALARRHGDADFAEVCAAEGARLGESIERHGWDGAWYRRA